MAHDASVSGKSMKGRESVKRTGIHSSLLGMPVLIRRVTAYRGSENKLMSILSRDRPDTIQLLSPAVISANPRTSPVKACGGKSLVPNGITE